MAQSDGVADQVTDPVRVVGIGGSLRDGSTSLTALNVALSGADAAGARTVCVAVRDLDLPLFTPAHAPPQAAIELCDTARNADALIWGTPTYHGSISGSMKNALDWLILLAGDDPPFLSNKPIGLLCTAGGVQGLQSVIAMEFIVRALRGWAVPLVQVVPQSHETFDPRGELVDVSMADQLRALGGEVVRAAWQFRHTGTCDYAEGRQFAQSADADVTS
jgi:FMN reductase